MAKITYSIIIPALNEADLIGQTIFSLKKYLRAQKLLDNTEIIIVAVKDKDDTGRIAKKALKDFKSSKLIEPLHKVGKGRDVQKGMLAANGDYILFMDADLATPLKHVVPAFRRLEKGADVVIGKRDLPSIHSGFRKFISLNANLITRLLVAPSYADTQCGFKAFNKESTKLIFDQLRVQGWAFDMEVIAIARQNGLTIVEMPINDWSEKKPPEKQLSGDNNMAAAVKTLREAVTIGWRRLRKAYKANP
jgi:glycosyltransferase involved in cell wall biosynthesis